MGPNTFLLRLLLNVKLVFQMFLFFKHLQVVMDPQLDTVEAVATTAWVAVTTVVEEATAGLLEVVVMDLEEAAAVATTRARPMEATLAHLMVQIVTTTAAIPAAPTDRAVTTEATAEAPTDQAVTMEAAHRTDPTATTTAATLALHMDPAVTMEETLALLTEATRDHRTVPTTTTAATLVPAETTEVLLTALPLPLLTLNLLAAITAPPMALLLATTVAAATVHLTLLLPFTATTTALQDPATEVETITTVLPTMEVEFSFKFTFL